MPAGQVMRLFPLLLLAFGLSGCRLPYDPPSPNPAHPPDTDQCPAMCVHLRTLTCEEGQPYYDSDKPGPLDVPNATCEEFCQEQQGKGVFINPRCVAQVPSCPAIEAWRKKDPQKECL